MFEQVEQPADAARLGEAIAAFYVAPSIDEIRSLGGPGSMPGYVVLIDPEGAVSTVETNGMDLGALAWTDRGLYFSDDEYDYRLDAAGLSKAENAKPQAQSIMFTLDSGTAVGVYNTGNTADGYRNDVAVTTAAGESRTYPVEGNYFAGADCGGRIFGLAADPGAHLTEASTMEGMQSSTDEGTAPQMLAQLYPPGADGGETVIAWRPAFDTSVGGNVPCKDSTMVFLSADIDADTDGSVNGAQQPTIVTWNVDTGEYRATPLAFDDTDPLTGDALDYVNHYPLALTGDSLEWIAPDGRVFATEVDSGVTTTRFDTGLDHRVGADATSLWTFTETSIHALNQDYTDSESPITYHVFARDTGAEVTDMSLAITSGEVNTAYLTWWRMAARPE